MNMQTEKQLSLEKKLFLGKAHRVQFAEVEQEEEKNSQTIAQALSLSDSVKGFDGALDAIEDEAKRGSGKGLGKFKNVLGDLKKLQSAKTKDKEAPKLRRDLAERADKWLTKDAKRNREDAAKNKEQAIGVLKEHWGALEKESTQLEFELKSVGAKLDLDPTPDSPTSKRYEELMAHKERLDVRKRAAELGVKETALRQDIKALDVQRNKLVEKETQLLEGLKKKETTKGRQDLQAVQSDLANLDIQRKKLSGALLEVAEKIDALEGGYAEVEYALLPRRAKDPVSIVKRQVVQAVALQVDVQKKVEELQDETKPEKAADLRRQIDSLSRNANALQLVAVNPPKKNGGNKGNSDSYRIMDGNEIAYIFKPQKGEAVAKDWPPGGGAPREALTSELNEHLKGTLGIDCGVARTTVASVTAGGFVAGKNCREPEQVGILTSAFQGATDAEDVFKDLKEKNKPADVKKFKESIEPGDVHNIALLDFLTLNLDRNPGNAMFLPDAKDKNKTRMVPIDAGNLLPPVRVFDADGVSNAMQAPVAADDEPITEGNLVMQLPAAALPFDDATVGKIAQLDPAELARMLMATDAKTCAGPLAGRIEKGTFQMVEHSVAFLQMATALDPRPTVNELGKMYAINDGFKKFKYLREQLEGNLTSKKALQILNDCVVQAALTAQEMTRQDDFQRQVRGLGGDTALRDLGWEPKKLDAEHQLFYLKKKMPDPTALEWIEKEVATLNAGPQELGPTFKTMSVGQQIDHLKKLRTEMDRLQRLADFGGDKAITQLLQEFQQRDIADRSFKPVDQMSLDNKIVFINTFETFHKLGGFKLYDLALSDGRLEKKKRDYYAVREALEKLGKKTNI